MTSRLDKLVSRRADLSRRLAGRAIRRGRVTVDGVAVVDPATTVPLDARVLFDDAPLEAAPRVVIWHKPAGVHCTVRDALGRPSLATAVPDLLKRGLHPVGRLDADTRGLLLLSSDGQFTQRILHPRRAAPRTYVATVDPPPDDALVEQLRSGVKTAAGVFEASVSTCQGAQITLTVHEGKHRMVRRMLANAGHPVQDLQRIAFGPFELGDLPIGSWRLPTPEEDASPLLQ